MATKLSTIKDSDTLLGSLALLRINILPDDYISSFIPFLATLFIEEHIDEVNIDTLISSFQKKYGFVIPRMPMLAILKNCSKEKIITRALDGRFYVNRALAIDHCFTEKACEQSKKYDQIVAKFRDYSLNTYHIILNDEQAEKIFISFLAENSSKTLTTKLDFKKPEGIGTKNSFLMARFVQHCAAEDIPTFDMIQDIASAHLIASAMVSEVEEEIETKKVPCRYNSLVLYLDTPIILRVLGLNTDEMQVSYEAMLQELHNRNNVFKIFQHTYNEIQGILTDCERWIENPLYNAKYASQALRTFISKKFNKGDIAIFIETLERRLKENRIEIDDTDYYSQSYNYLQIDETPIRNAIINTYTSNSPNFNIHSKEYTIECDVKSISAIFKLRRKRIYNSYSRAKYLFVTNNTTLASLSRRFTEKENPSYSHRIYPCITDVLLGTAIWLSAPVQKIDTFSRKKLMADCSAAVMPSEVLVSNLSESIERMYSQNKLQKEDYYLLKTHAFDTYYLVGKTLNDESAFSDKITEEILEEIKSEITAPLIKQIQEKDDMIKNTEQWAKQLADDKKKKEEEQFLLEEEANSYASKRISQIEIALIPILLALLSLFIILLVNLIPVPSPFSIILNIISALFSVIASSLLAMLHFDVLAVRNKAKHYFAKRYLINQYKKALS